jgi:hypothetical protein
MNESVLGLRLAPIVFVLWSGTAIAETKISADANLEGGYASNPFLGSGGDTGAATATASIMPKIVFEEATSSLSLTGNAGRTLYSRSGYRANENYGLQGAYLRKLSPLSSFNISAGYSQSTQNALQPILSPIQGIDTGVNILDPSAIETLGQRVKIFNGSAGFTTTLSPRLSLSAQAYGSIVKYPTRGSFAQDYDSFGGGLNLSYALNDRISLGPSVSYSRSVYKNDLFGSSNQISPGITVNMRFPSRLRLTLTGAAAISTIDQAGLSTTRTSLNASANLCRDGNRSSICIDARRSTSPTAFSGLSNVTSVGANYSYRLTPRSRFDLNANYSKTHTLDNTAIARDLSFASAGGNFSRQMTPRLSFMVKAFYTKSFEAIIATRDNIYGGVGVSYRLGRTS